jgi:hypothetical protein
MAGSLRDGALAGTEAQGMDCRTFVGAASQSSFWTPTSGRSASMPHGAPHALHLVVHNRFFPSHHLLLPSHCLVHGAVVIRVLTSVERAHRSDGEGNGGALREAS